MTASRARPVLAEPLGRVSRLCAVAAIAVGALVLAGWLLGVRALMQVLPGQVAMVPNTAVGILLAGVALWLRASRAGRWAIMTSRAAAAVAGLLGFLNLIEYGSGRSLGIDELLFRDPAGLTSVFPGRMAVATAFGFVALAAALLTLDFRRAPWMSDGLALVPGVLAMISLTGYVYGLQSLAWAGTYKGMAIHTALAFLFLTVGVLLVQTGGLSRLLVSDTAGGRLARRVLPVALLAPLVVGKLRIVGQEHGLYGVELGRTLDNVSDALILTVILLWTAAALMRVDEKRMSSEKALRGAEEQYRLLFENSPQPMWVVDRETLRYAAVNDAAVQHYGYSRDEFLSMDIRQIRPADDVAAVQRALPKEMAGLEKQGVWRHLKKDGTLIHVEIATHTLTFAGRSAWLVLAYDVTERLRAEEALRQSEARLHSLFDGMLEGFAYCEMLYENGEPTDFVYLEVNRTFEGLTGLKDVVGKRVTEVIPGIRESSPQLFEVYDRVASTGKSERFEAFVDALGIWFSISAYCPKKGHFVAVFDNITERKRADERVRQLNRLLRTISEVNQLIVQKEDREALLSGACHILVEHGGFLLVWVGFADAASGLVVPAARAGKRPDYLDGLVFRFDESPEGRGAVGTAIRTGRSAVVGDVETDPSAAPWRERMLAYGFGTVAGFPLRSHGAVMGALAVYASKALEIGDEETTLLDELAGDLGFALEALDNRDERARSEEALARRELYFRSLIEHALDIVAVIAPGGELRYASPSGERVLGYPPAELAGLNAFDLIHPDDRSLAESKFRRSLETGTKFEHLEARVRHRNGSWRTLSFIGRPLPPETGMQGLIINARDLTDRQQLEAQLRVSQKMEGIGRLAGGVAHDFNNLLTAILGYSELMEAQLPDDEELRSSLREIRHAGERAAALTRQLLAFSRKQVLQPRVLDLNAVVSEMEKLLRRLIGEDVALTTRLDPGLESIKADPGQLEQVLMNLAVNARDAMPEGGTLTIETANAVLDSRFTTANPGAHSGEYAILTVADTGIGMSDDVRSHAFEPFFTTKEHGKGTGLGLATAYGIVKQSDGYITVDSEPGRGATFRIYFPRAAGMAAVFRRGERAALSPRGTETILLVEDESGVRRLSRTILEAQGYTVLEAASGDEALQVARSHTGEINLVATDVVMPGMSGRVLWDRLRALRPDSRVLFISGYTDDAIAKHGVLEPGIAFLQKPFTPHGFAEKVREVLDAAPGPGA